MRIVEFEQLRFKRVVGGLGASQGQGIDAQELHRNLSAINIHFNDIQLL